MALKLKLARTSINSVGTEMYISDVTGNYSSENSVGWGTPNIDRGTTSVFFEAWYNTSKGKEPITVLPYNPQDVDNVVLKTTRDGYIEVIAVALPITAPYSEGAWGTINATPARMENGVVVAKTIQEAYEDVTNPSVSFKTLLLARIAIYRSRKNLELIELMQVKKDDRAHNRELVDLEKKFNFVKGLLEGARYLWCSDKYVKAQLLVESFDEILKEYGEV